MLSRCEQARYQCVKDIYTSTWLHLNNIEKIEVFYSPVFSYKTSHILKIFSTEYIRRKHNYVFFVIPRQICILGVCRIAFKLGNFKDLCRVPIRLGSNLSNLETMHFSQRKSSPFAIFWVRHAKKNCIWPQFARISH